MVDFKIIGIYCTIFVSNYIDSVMVNVSIYIEIIIYGDVVGYVFNFAHNNDF